MNPTLMLIAIVASACALPKSKPDAGSDAVAKAVAAAEQDHQDLTEKKNEKRQLTLTGLGANNNNQFLYSNLSPDLNFGNTGIYGNTGFGQGGGILTSPPISILGTDYNSLGQNYGGGSGILLNNPSFGVQQDPYLIYSNPNYGAGGIGLGTGLGTNVGLGTNIGLGGGLGGGSGVIYQIPYGGGYNPYNTGVGGYGLGNVGGVGTLGGFGGINSLGGIGGLGGVGGYRGYGLGGYGGLGGVGGSGIGGYGGLGGVSGSGIGGYGGLGGVSGSGIGGYGGLGGVSGIGGYSGFGGGIGGLSGGRGFNPGIGVVSQFGGPGYAGTAVRSPGYGVLSTTDPNLLGGLEGSVGSEALMEGSDTTAMSTSEINRKASDHLPKNGKSPGGKGLSSDVTIISNVISDVIVTSPISWLFS